MSVANIILQAFQDRPIDVADSVAEVMKEKLKEVLAAKREEVGKSLFAGTKTDE